MKQYFSRIVADHWCAKNKSEEDAHKLAREMERRIISSDQVLDFKAEFIDKVSRINSAHPRCKPLHLSIDKAHHDKGDIVFWMDGVFHLDLILAKESIKKDSDAANTCCICHVNYVDSANGFDTCDSCLKNI